MSLVRRMICTGTKIRLPLARLAGIVLVLLTEGMPAGADSEAPPPISGPRDLMNLQGIDQSHFNLLADGVPWQEGENETMLKILYRLSRDFRLRDVEAWSRGDPDLAELAQDPDASRGEIFRLAGRVVSLEVVRPVAEVARRFELSRYYRCRFLLAGSDQPAVVFARTVPEAWKTRQSIDAPAGAFAVFLKLGGEGPDEPVPVFVASRIAWYPPTLLGDLGMDAGLFDDVRPRDRLTARNRECFYQLLAAAGRSDTGALAAEATRELKRTGKDRFSVVPLFTEPLKQQGRLVVLSGTARQVIPIRVSDEDIVSRFGIDQYWQVFLFTEDSQQNPLVFCVRQIPEGMPTGEGPEFGQYVTVAGFSFNEWAYRNRRSGDASSGEPEWQLAPLLIGRDLKWHPPQKRATSPLLGAIAGGLFVLALLGIWVALWRYSRADKQFREKRIARQFAANSATSLDRISLDAQGPPDFSGLEQAAPSKSDVSGKSANLSDNEPKAKLSRNDAGEHGPTA